MSYRGSASWLDDRFVMARGRLQFGEEKIDVGGACLLNSDCTQVWCVLGKCHYPATQTADCPMARAA